MRAAPGAARARVLDAAERLFHRRGYAAVSVQDLARALRIRAASLYYHAPGGKAELFQRVLERRLDLLGAALQRALEAEPGLGRQLLRAAEALLSRGPIGLHRLLLADLPELPAARRRALTRRLYERLLAPLRGAFARAAEGGETRPVDPDLMAGSFLSVLDGVWYAAEVQVVAVSRAAMLGSVIDVLLHGLTPPPRRRAGPRRALRRR